MKNLTPKGFDPLRDQADRKAAKEKKEIRRKTLRKVISVILLPILIIVGMYAVGGTDGFSNWNSVRKSLGKFGDGTVSQKDANELVRVVKGIENVRGNGSALAGVYCVYALQMLSEGQNKNAEHALQVLRDDYATKQPFASLWDMSNLTVECDACASKPQYVKCKMCNGTGRLAISGNKLKNSARGIPISRKCGMCNGTGRVRVNPASKSGGKPGRKISPELVNENLEKALTRSKILVKLKCIQCALSLKPLFGEKGDD